MAYAVFQLIAQFTYSVLGDPFIVGAVLSAFLLILLVSLKANGVVIMTAFVPILTGLIVSTTDTNFLFLPPWALLAVFIIMGFMFGAIVWFTFLR